MFLASGIFTAYFDLLSYPLVTLGIPLIIFSIKYYKELIVQDNKQAISAIVSNSSFWCIGYGGMFVGKWLLAWYVSDISVIIQSVNQLQYRMSSHVAAYEGGRAITPVLAIIKNLYLVFNEPIFAVLFFVFITCLYKLRMIKHVSGSQDYTVIKNALRIIMLYPFIWYALLCNHSFVHPFFTYRTLSIFVFAEGCLIATCFMEKRCDTV